MRAHGRDRAEGLLDVLRGVLKLRLRDERSHHRLHQMLLDRGDHRRQRRVDVMYPRRLPGPLPIAHGDQERIPAPDGVLVHAPDRPALGVLRQRTHHGNAVLLLDLLLRGEDRIHGEGEVDDLRRRPPGQQLPALDLLAVLRRVGACRPDDGLSVAACHQHKAFPGGRRAVVSGHQLPVFHLVAQRLKLTEPFLEGLTLLALDRLALAHRPPGRELLHIFQDDHPRAHRARPAQHDPRKAADVAVHKGTALCLGEVLAIGAEPGQAHRAAGAYFLRVYVPDGRLQVQGVRVVGLVHQDGRRVVVDGDRHRAARGKLNACAGPAATGEVVYNDFVQEVDLSVHNPSSNKLIFCPMPAALSASWAARSCSMRRISSGSRCFFTRRLSKADRFW